MAGKTRELIPIADIGEVIIDIRGQNVIIATDLARLYGVTTKALNQAVRRNAARFPSDFVFQLSDEEKKEVVTNCDHLRNLRFSSSLPYAFTEHAPIERLPRNRQYLYFISSQRPRRRQHDDEAGGEGHRHAVVAPAALVGLGQQVAGGDIEEGAGG